MIGNRIIWTGNGRVWRTKIAVLVLLMFMLLIGTGTVRSHPHVIPTISITSVVADESVTIQTHNFPAGHSFTVRMGEMYTAALGGTVITTTPSAGGSFAVTYQIPDSLKGRGRIAIRLDSTWGGYYSYNWFYNNTANVGVAGSPQPISSGAVYSGIPTFKITEVDEGKSVTIETNNFPSNMVFTVTMGKMYTRGVDGIVVEPAIDSKEGGTLVWSFDIPEALKNDAKIAIRAQTAHANPFYAFNYFHNNTTTGNNADNSNSNGATGGGNAVYYGIPTFTVCTVTKDGNATILTKNFPTNQTFAVTMGAMYTQGIGGTPVEPLASSDKASDRYTFTIPAGLKGAGRISIRAQTAHAYPYYAYNWFYNNSTTMDHCQ
ncbi:MAG: hypothetical protein GY805_31065 [Chloroflexi bacterium]|nr:hypothetical protein [Chloroflexota bacterium]